MGLAVWKFPIPFGIGVEPWVTMPKGSRPLHVDVQNGVPCVWALVNPDLMSERLRQTKVKVYATGQEVDPGDTYLGTYKIDWTVWHVFVGSVERPAP